jgi:hypothetical protein
VKRTLAPPQPSPRAQPPAPHPLLGTFPLAVMAVAAFLVIFTLTMARLSAGEDSPLHQSTGASRIAASSGAHAATTRARGAGKPATWELS